MTRVTTGAMIWVLKNREGKYLAPTYLSKFRHVTIGDCVPEQVYAHRYFDRNVAAGVCVTLNGLDNPNWRLVRLRSAKAIPEGK